MLKPFFCCVRQDAATSNKPRREPVKKKNGSTKTSVKNVIGYRRSCKAEGVGLSHYILIGKDLKDKK